MQCMSLLPTNLKYHAFTETLADHTIEGLITYFAIPIVRRRSLSRSSLQNLAHFAVDC